MVFIDETDEISGTCDTDDEGIEDDHDESQIANEEHNKNQHSIPGGAVKKSGTCDLLIERCRFGSFSPLHGPIPHKPFFCPL